MALYLRTGKPSKADLIRGILDYWDPCRKRESAGYMYYNYEAETIAQTIRKNSKVSTVAKQVIELIDDKLESEGLEYRVDEKNASRVAEAMISAVKEM